jgi:hypothetical protein
MQGLCTLFHPQATTFDQENVNSASGKIYGE